MYMYGVSCLIRPSSVILGKNLMDKIKTVVTQKYRFFTILINSHVKRSPLYIDTEKKQQI